MVWTVDPLSRKIQVNSNITRLTIPKWSLTVDAIETNKRFKRSTIHKRRKAGRTFYHVYKFVYKRRCVWVRSGTKTSFFSCGRLKYTGRRFGKIEPILSLSETSNWRWQSLIGREWVCFTTRVPSAFVWASMSWWTSISTMVRSYPITTTMSTPAGLFTA